MTSVWWPREFDGREFTDKARSFLYDPRRSRVAWLLLKAVRDGVDVLAHNLSPLVIRYEYVGQERS